MILGSSKNPVTLIGQVEPTNWKRVIPRPHAGLNSKGFLLCDLCASVLAYLHACCLILSFLQVLFIVLN